MIFVTFAGPTYGEKERKEGDYEVYEISTNYDEFIKIPVNKKGETLQDQANSKRRPRISLFKTFLLDNKTKKVKVKPTFIGNIYDVRKN